MPNIIGVRFRTSPRVYYFAPTEGEEYEKNSRVIVETQRGMELATVVIPVTDVDESKIVAPLKPVLRKATDADIQAATADEKSKQEILATAKQKVAARGLDMKIVDCEFTVDHGKLVLYFTAEQRVDFRELVRDLASAFHMRIDLRQIGARDECKLIGSLGACGLPCCCGRFESDNEHVSIKMAKNQSLALTPNKINGMCGRLLCCLSYENKTYEDVLKRCPKHGTFVTCPDGRRGSVVSVTPLTEKVRVRIGDDENFEFCEYLLDELVTDRGEQPERNSNDKPRHDKGQGKEKPNKDRPNKDKPNRVKPNKDRQDRDGKHIDNKTAANDGAANGDGNAPAADGERKKNNKLRRNRNKHRHGNNNNRPQQQGGGNDGESGE